MNKFEHLKERLDQFYAPQGGYHAFALIAERTELSNEAKIKLIAERFSVSQRTALRWLYRDKGERQ